MYTPANGVVRRAHRDPAPRAFKKWVRVEPDPCALVPRMTRGSNLTNPAECLSCSKIIRVGVLRTETPLNYYSLRDKTYQAMFKTEGIHIKRK